MGLSLSLAVQPCSRRAPRGAAPGLAGIRIAPFSFQSWLGDQQFPGLVIVIKVSPTKKNNLKRED